MQYDSMSPAPVGKLLVFAFLSFYMNEVALTLPLSYTACETSMRTSWKIKMILCCSRTMTHKARLWICHPTLRPRPFESSPVPG